jgi:hypothetical protein
MHSSSSAGLLVPGPVLVVHVFVHEDVFIAWPDLADVPVDVPIRAHTSTLEAPLLLGALLLTVTRVASPTGAADLQGPLCTSHQHYLFK